jgi:hypothetical protein
MNTTKAQIETNIFGLSLQLSNDIHMHISEKTYSRNAHQVFINIWEQIINKE